MRVTLAKTKCFNYNITMNCTNCPRSCNVDRTLRAGFCGTKGIVLSRVSRHNWEEPCISGAKGSGTVFFAGCNLKCRFCQNYDISVAPHGVEVSFKQLAEVFLYLQDEGVANINLVTPSHIADEVAKALELVKHKLRLPVVYNTASYENVSALKKLEGLVDVYLPDLKFCDATVSKTLCGVENYFEVACAAIKEMMRQQPAQVFDADGYIQKGVIIRHLVLPGFTEDSKRILDWIAKQNKNAFVSLMSQYFPARIDAAFPQLNRRLFKHEYQSVLDYFFNVGLHNGFMQDAASATADYLPDFDDKEVKKILKEIAVRYGNN